MASDAKSEMSKIVEFAKRRIKDIEEDIKKKNEELTVWKMALAHLNPCEDCDGAGEYRAFIAPDETDVVKCEKCGGKGVLA